MKTKAVRNSTPLASPNRLTKVRLQFSAPEAERVSVAGTFNNWQLDATWMRQDENGVWAVELELPPGRYEYRFVVNGSGWCSDPQAVDKTPNPFGGYNAVLHVSGPVDYRDTDKQSPSVVEKAGPTRNLSSIHSSQRVSFSSGPG